MRVIGITGKAGAGKDTAATLLSKMYPNSRIYHFADPLKEACSAAFGIPLAHFNQREIKEMENPFWRKSPRWMAQFVGTEMFRNLIGEDFWIRRAEMEYVNADADGIGTLIVPDVRFDNEANWIGEHSGTMLEIVRSGIPEVGISGHASEAGINWNNYRGEYELIYNDGSFDDLNTQLNRINFN